MTSTIDANVVSKPRKISRRVAPKEDPKIGARQDFQNFQSVLMRVLPRYPDACQAVADAIEEMRARNVARLLPDIISQCPPRSS